MKKIMISMLLFGLLLTGCSNEQKTEKKELTPLEKEIKELKDFQVTDKTYDNEDLEPFNKMQGYLYRLQEGQGRDSLELIELLPPTKENIKKLEEFGENYKFLSNVIIPCYVSYLGSENGWVKYYPKQMGEKDFTRYFATDPEYLYTPEDTLTDLFGTEKIREIEQFQINE